MFHKFNIDFLIEIFVFLILNPGKGKITVIVCVQIYDYTLYNFNKYMKIGCGFAPLLLSISNCNTTHNKILTCSGTIIIYEMWPITFAFSPKST